jgi:hypothetical protein
MIAGAVPLENERSKVFFFSREVLS